MRSVSGFTPNSALRINLFALFEAIFESNEFPVESYGKLFQQAMEWNTKFGRVLFSLAVEGKVRTYSEWKRFVQESLGSEDITSDFSFFDAVANISVKKHEPLPALITRFRTTALKAKISMLGF